MKLLGMIALLVLLPQVAAARPYRIASIDQSAVRVLDVDSLRARPDGKVTALVTGIGKRARSPLDPRAMVQQTLVEFDCAAQSWRAMSEVTLAPDLTRTSFSNTVSEWRKAAGGEQDVLAAACSPAPDPKLNIEAPNLAALVGAVQGAID